jgi:TRAP-type C4-dicarboxylate transport system permease small subunit
MDTGSVKRWLVLFLGILVAILIADLVSRSIVLITGVKGWPAYIVNLVLYAAFLFAVLSVMKKYARIDVFRFDRD